MQRRIVERPTTAFTLSLVGLALQMVSAILFAYMVLYGFGNGFWGPGMMVGSWMMGVSWSMVSGWWLLSILSVVVVALGVFGVSWINTSDLDRVRTGSILVLIASVIAFPTMFGLVAGSLLMFVGAILGLTWQPLPPKSGVQA